MKEYLSVTTTMDMSPIHYRIGTIIISTPGIRIDPGYDNLFNSIGSRINSID